MVKNILVTGNLGYVGSVLVPDLTKKYHVTGFDIGYFKNCNLEPKKKIKNFKQIYKDIRNINIYDLKNIDCVIHLAALSNDPLENLITRLQLI